MKHKIWFYVSMSLCIITIIAIIGTGIWVYIDDQRFSAHQEDAVLAFSSTGQADRAEGDEDSGAGKGQNEESEDQNISAEKGLLSVEITLPASFFEGSSQDEIMASANEDGIKDVTVNSDGSVTYKMSKSKHKEMLAEYKKSIDDMISGMLDGPDKVASFTDIKYNDNISELNVYVDKAKYNEMDSMSVLAFYVSGLYYQALNGTDSSDLEVVVNFIDKDTDEVFQSGSSKDLGE